MPDMSVQHLEWKALAIGFVAYWAMLAPIYLPWRPALPQPIAEAITWLPYVAAFVAGVVFSIFSRGNRDVDCVALGVVIALSVGLINFAGPAIGFQSDLPGAKYSFLVVLVASLITVPLVLAGAGFKGLFTSAKRP